MGFKENEKCFCLVVVENVVGGDGLEETTVKSNRDA
ncbi:hypothetical protein A2U01_0053201, partial [Trifolium medium]|nr:hypothetical protein [Trifolium medium]